MQRMHKLCVLIGMSAASTMAMAQAAPPAGPPPPAGLAVEVQRNYAAVKENIIKSAEKMPEEGYSYKPEPDIRVFARVVNHVTEAQVRSCGAVNHTPADQLPKVPADTASKAEIVAALKASFAACDTAYGSATDANMVEVLSLGKASRTRAGLLWGNASHDNEQYATLALYLRLKGINPPSMEK